VKCFEAYDRKGLDKVNFWTTVYALEKQSEHPLATGICAHAEKYADVTSKVKDFLARNGRGVSGVVNGIHMAVGNRGWMSECHIPVPEDVDEAMRQVEMDGKTAVCVAVESEIVASISLSDTLKANANAMVEHLKRNKVEVWMVTGDRSQTAQRIGAEVGIDADHIKAEVLPADKSAIVKQLQNTISFKTNKSHVVAFVGDGVNDAPSLAQADVGIAIGAGTDVAIASAQVVLMKSKMADVVTCLDLSRVALNRIRLNFVWALVYNVVMIPVAAGVLYPFTRTCVPPFVAGLCMAMSSISVVVSSLLLRGYKPPRVDARQVGSRKSLVTRVAFTPRKSSHLNKSLLSEDTAEFELVALEEE